jgi:hypothetical protein
VRDSARLRTLKFKQVAYVDVNLAKALVPKRNLVQHAIEEWTMTLRESDVMLDGCRRGPHKSNLEFHWVGGASFFRLTICATSST